MATAAGHVVAALRTTVNIITLLLLLYRNAIITIITNYYCYYQCYYQYDYYH